VIAAVLLLVAGGVPDHPAGRRVLVLLAIPGLAYGTYLLGFAGTVPLVADGHLGDRRTGPARPPDALCDRHHGHPCPRHRPA